MPKAAKTQTKDYVAVTRLSYIADGERHVVEPGEIASNIPGESIKWLKEQGHIKEPDEAPADDAKDGE